MILEYWQLRKRWGEFPLQCYTKGKWLGLHLNEGLFLEGIELGECCALSSKGRVSIYLEFQTSRVLFQISAVCHICAYIWELCKANISIFYREGPRGVMSPIYPISNGVIIIIWEKSFQDSINRLRGEESLVKKSIPSS